jgi:hypothetical protein
MCRFDVIPKPVWAIGFALEQSLHVVTLACSASGILKQLEYKRVFLVYKILFFSRPSQFLL